MTRIAAGIEYDGTRFVGWQRQPQGRSVQRAVEEALGAVAAEPVRLVCAGRTDAGVHALSQVAHFDTDRVRGPRSWVLGANSHLPEDVAVLWAKEMPQDFHARYSAVSRTYAYFICERGTRPALLRTRAAWVRETLDLERMRAGADHLLGVHDFSAFRAAECQARSPVRTLRRLTLERRDGLLCITVEADAFLHHMVRNIAGSLIEVGRLRRDPRWVLEVLASCDRRRGGPTAPAQGLFLTAVEYPPGFDLPFGSACTRASSGR